MDRRFAVALLLATALTLPGQGWAQDDGTSGRSEENGSGNGESNNGAGSGNGSETGGAGSNGNGNGAANGNNGQGNGNNGQGNGNTGQGNGNTGQGNVTPAPEGNGRDESNTPEAEAPAVEPVAEELGEPEQDVVYSESEVLRAVESGEAVPLQSLLPDVQSRTGGEVIEARLQRRSGTLVYAVRVLTPQGVVSTQYYDARSGQFLVQ